MPDAHNPIGERYHELTKSMIKEVMNFADTILYYDL
jgi:hypothetical protein